jgi:hypothetical protein
MNEECIRIVINLAYVFDSSLKLKRLLGPTKTERTMLYKVSGIKGTESLIYPWPLPLTHLMLYVCYINKIQKIRTLRTIN